VAGSCERGNEPSVSIKGYLNGPWLLEDSPSCSWLFVLSVGPLVNIRGESALTGVIYCVSYYRRL